jgi:hypothetical protein
VFPGSSAAGFEADRAHPRGSFFDRRERAAPGARTEVDVEIVARWLGEASGQGRCVRPTTCEAPKMSSRACNGFSSAARFTIRRGRLYCPADGLVLVVSALAMVAINAFFVAAEFAIVRVRVTRIEDLVQRGVRRRAAAREVLRNLDAMISACQLGITLASLALGWDRRARVRPPDRAGVRPWRALRAEGGPHHGDRGAFL